jgi:uncharacterized membrane protein
MGSPTSPHRLRKVAGFIGRELRRLGISAFVAILVMIYLHGIGVIYAMVAGILDALD